jgi:heme-degrading monooxygenase HmoA
VIYRLWTTGVDPMRVEEYRTFARERSLPMFRSQRGFRDVVFVDAGGGEHWVLTVWDSEEDVDTLATSPSYVGTARELGETGLLTGAQTVRLLASEVEGPPPPDVTPDARRRGPG